MVTISTIISTLKGVIPWVKGVFSTEWGKALPWLLVLILGTICFGAIKSCNQNQDMYDKQLSINARNARASHDKTQMLEVQIAKKNAKNLVLSEQVNKVLDSLEIKQKQLKELRSIKLERVTERVVTEYDTLYEFIEINPTTPNKFTSVQDDCLTIHGEFTPNGLKLSTESNLDIYDINYWERRNIFGWGWTPKWGKKQYFQTLVTNCGDTVKENTKITFGH